MYRDWLLPRKKNRKNKNLSLVVKYIKKTEMWNINITYRGQTGILKKHKQFPYENKVWPPDTPKKKKKMELCVKPIGTKQTNWKNISQTHIKIRSDHREGQIKLKKG